MKTMFVMRRPSGELLTPVAGLVDDLGGRQVPPQPELPGGAERAAHGAARLARDAEGGALTPRPACRVAHEHRFDDATVVERMQGLVGEPRIRRLPLAPDEGVESIGLVERVAQRARERMDVAERGGSAGPDMVSQLACPEGGLSPLGEPGEKLLWRRAGDARPRVARTLGREVEQGQGRGRRLAVPASAAQSARGGRAVRRAWPRRAGARRSGTDIAPGW
jgi:hypothetical protein